MDFIEVLNDPAGRRIVEMIEELADETEPVLVRIRTNLIKELKKEFNYKYILY